MTMIHALVSLSPAVLAAVPLGLALLSVLWQVFIRRLPIHRFGTRDVIEALKWEPLAVQQRISARGSLTRFGWFLLRRRHHHRLATELRIGS